MMIDLLKNLSEIEKYILMLSGAAFALAGLYMMLKPSRTDGETKLEVLGFKFNASSGGLIVFLVGSAVMVGSALAPENNASNLGERKYATESINTDAGLERTPAVEAKAGEKFGENPTALEQVEIEPNGSNKQAHAIDPDIKYMGSLDSELGDDEDWLYVKKRDDFQTVEISIENKGNKNYTSNCDFSIYNDQGSEIHVMKLPKKGNQTIKQPVRIEVEGIYVKLFCSNKRSYAYSIKTSFVN